VGYNVDLFLGINRSGREMVVFTIFPSQFWFLNTNQIISCPGIGVEWKFRSAGLRKSFPTTRVGVEQMSAQEPPSEPPASSSKPDDASTSESVPLLSEHQDGDASMDTSPDEPQPPEETWDDIPEDVRNAGVEEIITRTRLIDNDIRVCLFLFLRDRVMM
jgi:hypothetical protein